jgi:hypothetical protein
VRINKKYLDQFGRETRSDTLLFLEGSDLGAIDHWACSIIKQSTAVSVTLMEADNTCEVYTAWIQPMTDREKLDLLLRAWKVTPTYNESRRGSSIYNAFEQVIREEKKEWLKKNR